MSCRARLRPGTELSNDVRVGNFVEVKNAQIADGAKVNHLSYIGDADVGARASFGCGAITVNYNWQKKDRTVIGEGARIGCNANLIAPVTIGRNAAVAAGSTIGSTVPDDALAVERAQHRNVEGWAARRGVGGASRRTRSDEEETN